MAEDFNLNANNYQDLLSKSQLAEAYWVKIIKKKFIFDRKNNFCVFIQTLFQYFNDSSSFGNDFFMNQEAKKNIEELFEYLKPFFVNSTDPDAALPHLREHFSLLIHFLKVKRPQRGICGFFSYRTFFYVVFSYETVHNGIQRKSDGKYGALFNGLLFIFGRRCVRRFRFVDSRSTAVNRL